MANDQTLILQAQRGDMAAFETLVQRYDKRVLAMAMSYVGDPDDAKDVYQEIFLRVYRALPRFEYRSKFSTWLYRIVVNVCNTHHTRRSRWKSVSLDRGAGEEASEGSLVDVIAADESTDGRLMATELSEQIGQALGSLSPRQRLVFILRHYHGFKIREIASMMDCAQGTVKRHLFTATHKLRDQLAEIRDKEYRQ